MNTLYTVFSFETLETMSDFPQPMLLDIDRQIRLLHMFEGRPRPFQCGLYVPALVFVIFCHLDMSVNMTVCSGGFPQAERLVKVAASFLQGGQSLHCQAEV